MSESDKRALYEELLRRREREGLSYRKLSEVSGVPIWRLTWWARKLAGKPPARRRSRFVELAPPSAGGRSRYELQLLSGRRVIVEGGFEDQTLTRLVRLLEAAC